ncbi:hypothetical protein K503DRAFT_802498 [Rhizopogon vinicolor AM-OR11-026]|uniref:RRM domain-containing protein n=1 Tax=Rhizopogon vinicolor AM-OR11-026 TaxID=1314800 RepID=A0A1B7MTB2_9AGAM|nr:hypothetical protein K503DRAFT_802498 [Rhizopogon vinicolor AM-OR11-026]
MPVLPKSLSGFTVIPIAYSHSTHYIYARAHVTSKSKASKPANVLPEARTLFIVNVPPDATERELALLFKHCGTVERVLFDFNSADNTLVENSPDSDEEMGEDADAEEADTGTDTEARPRKKRKIYTSEPTPPEVISLPNQSLRILHKTGSCAHLIFLDASSLAKALSPSASSKPLPWPSSEEPRGLSHYLAKYDAERPPLDTIRAHADSYMERFEFDLAKSKQEAKYRKGEAVVDEDGFTLVTRGGAYGQTLGGGVGVASKKFMLTGKTGSRKRKEKKQEKETFYAFQKAEKQRKAILDLKRNFEADKQRVEKLKESRRFKPY